MERQPRAVTIHSLELLSCPLPGFTLRVTCSKGTYIRVLAEDMGRALGCGAHLTGLRRTRVGPLNLEGAATLAELEAGGEEGRAAFLKPVDSLLASLPAVELQLAEMERFSHGNPVAAPEGMGAAARVYGAGRLLGLGQLKADGLLWPKRLIANAA